MLHPLDLPSARRALEVWLVELPEWTPGWRDRDFDCCLRSPYRRCVPEDLPLELLHRLTNRLEVEVESGVNLVRERLPDDLDPKSVRWAVVTAFSVWTAMLTRDLVDDRDAIDAALDLHVRPAINRWTREQTEHLLVAGSDDQPSE
jgi:hypothetical protein